MLWLRDKQVYQAFINQWIDIDILQPLLRVIHYGSYTTNGVNRQKHRMSMWENKED